MFSKVCLILSCVFSIAIVITYIMYAIAEHSGNYVHFFRREYFVPYSYYALIISFSLLLIGVVRERFFKKPIKIVTLTLIGAFFLHTIFNMLQIFDPTKYSSYICYDTLLSCTDAHDRYERKNIEYNGKTLSSRYRKPVGISDDQFVCLYVGELLSSNYYVYIMQNPENYVDVLSQWTIDKIEIYNTNKNDQNKERSEPAYDIAELLLSTDDEGIIEAGIINDFLTFINDDNIERKQGMSTGLLFDASKRTRIRVHFKECETIVWDGEIRIDDYGNYLIQKSDLENLVASPYNGFYSLEGYSNLSDFIKEAIKIGKV